MIGIYHIRNLKTGKVYVGQSGNISERWLDHKSYLNNKNHHNRHLQHAWNKDGSDNFVFEILTECGVEDLTKLEQQFFDAVPKGMAYNIGRFVDCRTRGVSPSAETRKKLSLAGMGRILSQKDRQKIKDKLEWKRQKLAAIHKDTKEEIVFESFTEAELKGFVRSSIKKCLRGQMITHHNFYWKKLGEELKFRERKSPPRRPIIDNKKQCSKCEQWLEIILFPKNNRKILSVCKVCRLANRPKKFGPRQPSPNKKAILKINPETNESIEYDSTLSAERQNQGNRKSIRVACNRLTMYNGFLWKWKSEK